MILRKQTVWLLTMLAVMVVLSGYYLVKGPQDQVPTSGQEQAVQKQEQDQLSDVIVESRQVDQPSGAAPVSGKKEGQTAAGQPSEQQKANSQDTPAPTQTVGNAVSPVAETASEIFQGYKMKREAQLQQQKDEQLAIISNTDSSAQAIADARTKYEQLSNQETATTNIEEMLKANGYQDAVVYINNDKVTVIVQKDKLSANEAVDIIAQVKQQLNVPATNVTVQYKAT
ncbi:SpoIIIAH-like family protein [Brevibacillus brevis]|uniref:SpoIIIAH-like family protein n=1 Tax=Brevibacillus brevis TaxID=1393 RepID=A0ABY9TEM2_BREBE|nr:SpoIIIAH-like family protein [Brevibacillus brevis]WNC17128.1 SpoIIIAH-like family protein [Brevibacillus brevis]